MAFFFIFVSRYLLRLACDVTLHHFHNEVMAVSAQFRPTIPMKLNAPDDLLSK